MNKMIKMTALIILSVMILFLMSGCIDPFAFKGEVQKWENPEKFPEIYDNYPFDLIPMHESDKLTVVTYAYDEEVDNDLYFLSYESGISIEEMQEYFTNLYKWEQNYKIERIKENKKEEIGASFMISCQIDKYMIIVAARQDPDFVKVEQHVTQQNWMEDIEEQE